MLGAAPHRAAQRMVAVLILAASLVTNVTAIQFNQQDQDFDMVVGNVKIIVWAYAAGRSSLELGQVLPSNITSGFNESICAYVKGGTCEYWPPPTLTTGQYILKVYDSYSYAWSPVFNITNYGNVTSTQPPWDQTATETATATPTPTPDDSQSDNPDPHNLELWLPLAFGLSCAVFSMVLIVIAVRKAAKQREGTGKTVRPWPGVEEGDAADTQPSGAANHESRGLLSYIHRRAAGAGDAGASEEGTDGDAPQHEKRKSLFSRLFTIYGGRRRAAGAGVDASAGTDGDAPRHEKRKSLFGSLFAIYGGRRRTARVGVDAGVGTEEVEGEEHGEEHSLKEGQRLFGFADGRGKTTPDEGEAGEASLGEEHEDIPLEERPPPYSEDISGSYRGDAAGTGKKNPGP